jgi:(p)ppGpp synthase/HD superfamily hydrolase
MAKQTRVENFESFMARMEIFFPHIQCVLISLLYRLVKNEFRSFARKSELNDDGSFKRYFEHLRRVVLILLDEAGIVSLIAVLVALAHDAVEDTRMTLEDITVLCGSGSLGPEVGKRVALCSKVPVQGFMERLEMHADWIVLAVKAADRIDNLRTLGTDPVFRAKQIKETTEKYPALLDLMVERADDANKAGCMRLRALFQKTLAAEAAI